MPYPDLTDRWTREEFLRAWETGEFDHRVELVNGEVWPVSIGGWHGPTVARIIRRLPEAFITTETLPSGDWLPDPDCWVRRPQAVPTGPVGSRLSTWDPADVLLVVEVSDETVMQDLQTKARLYGRAGWPVYWVVTRTAIYEHTDPYDLGYRNRTEHLPGDLIPVRYAGTELPVADLITS